MGKLSPSIKSAKFPLTLMKTPSTVTPSQPNFQKPRPPFSRKSPKKSPAQIPQKPIFKSPDLTDAKRTFDSIVSSYRNPLDLASYNHLLQNFCHVSTTSEDSLSLLHHMKFKTPSFVPDRSTYHILLSQSDEISTVHKTLNLMAERGFPPDRVSIDIAVRSLCAVGREDEACELVKQLAGRNSLPDEYTYNFLIRHLCKTKVLSTVYEFIEELRNSFDLKPDLVTYTILINAVCKSKNLREATRLLGVLADAGFKPDCFLYNTIMKGYCVLDRGNETLGVYKTMKEEGIEPDLVTYNTLIFGLSKSGKVAEAKKFLNVMAEMGHFPDTVTYTSLMNGMCRKGEAVGALGLLKEMEERGCTPNSCTYNTLLYGLCKSRFLEKGMELYGVMRSEGMRLEAASYATFVRVLCSENRIAEAYEVFDYALETKSLTDVAAYSALESTLKWVKKVRG